jgi:hypothetical protein
LKINHLATLLVFQSESCKAARFFLVQNTNAEKNIPNDH